MKTQKGMADLGGIMAMGASVAIGFVVFVVVLTLGGSLLSSFAASLTPGSNAQMINGNGSAGLLQISGQSTNIGLVIGITLILLILIGGLGFFLYNKQQ
jgi:hypothetical protein